MSHANTDIICRLLHMTRDATYPSNGRGHTIKIHRNRHLYCTVRIAQKDLTQAKQNAGRAHGDCHKCAMCAALVARQGIQATRDAQQVPRSRHARKLAAPFFGSVRIHPQRFPMSERENSSADPFVDFDLICEFPSADGAFAELRRYVRAIHEFLPHASAQQGIRRISAVATQRLFEVRRDIRTCSHGRRALSM